MKYDVYVSKMVPSTQASKKSEIILYYGFV